MSAELHRLILTYGYWLMLFGALIEGETFLLAGGIAAQQGLLHLPGLLSLALVGSCIHDISFFLIGRLFGKRYFQKTESKFSRILRLLEKYGVWLIIGLRYAYGLRTMIPIAIGLSDLSAKKFIFYDVIGGILWSCTFILGGYFLGATFERFFRLLSRYEDWSFGILTVVLIFLVLFASAYWKFRKPAEKTGLKG